MVWSGMGFWDGSFLFCISVLISSFFDYLIFTMSGADIACYNRVSFCF